MFADYERVMGNATDLIKGLGEYYCIGLCENRCVKHLVAPEGAA